MLISVENRPDVLQDKNIETDTLIFCFVDSRSADFDLEMLCKRREAREFVHLANLYHWDSVRVQTKEVQLELGHRTIEMVDTVTESNSYRLIAVDIAEEDRDQRRMTMIEMMNNFVVDVNEYLYLKNEMVENEYFVVDKNVSLAMNGNYLCQRMVQMLTKVVLATAEMLALVLKVYQLLLLLMFPYRNRMKHHLIRYQSIY